MATRFRRSRGGVVVTFHPDEAVVLRSLLHQLEEMLATDEPETDADIDPLAAAVGIGGSTEPPADPAIARLLPDAYPDDAEAAADFRRYTELGLRERKRAAIRTALAGLATPGARRTLGTEEAHAWLAALNDLRLVIGTRLDLRDDADRIEIAPEEDDPRRTLYDVYDWLTLLQETLVRALW
ncbi:DUF2017 domain-containing protein [soil metagenome]